MKKNIQQVVVITGGNRGIGRTIAELFFDRGYDVAICSRSPKDSSLPKEFFHSCVDVRDKDQLNQFTQEVIKHFGAINVFICNAGVSRWKPLGQIDKDFVESVIETNLLGTLWGCAVAAENLSSPGSIVNISSLAGKRGSANNTAYCAAKFAVNGITQSLAKELGPQGIRVNAVCPVYVETDEILSALNSSNSPAQGQSARNYLDQFTQSQTALNRLPTTTEIAEAVFFLASPSASAITGQCINIDCGVFPQ